MKRYLIFFLHLIFSTLATFPVGIAIHGQFERLRSAVSAAPIAVFDAKSFVWTFVLAGLVLGYICFSQWGGRSAFYVWSIPASLLLTRIITFPSRSVFTSGFRDGWLYFFGQQACPALPDVHASAIAGQCALRMFALGLCYASAAYSLGAIAKHLRILEFRPKEGIVEQTDS